VYLAKLSQLTVLSKAYLSWVCNLVLDQVLGHSMFWCWYYTDSKSWCSRYTTDGDKRDYKSEINRSKYLIVVYIQVGTGEVNQRIESSQRYINKRESNRKLQKNTVFSILSRRLLLILDLEDICLFHTMTLSFSV